MAWDPSLAQELLGAVGVAKKERKGRNEGKEKKRREKKRKKKEKRKEIREKKKEKTAWYDGCSLGNFKSLKENVHI